jgi:hypothetical protein
VGLHDALRDLEPETEAEASGLLRLPEGIEDPVHLLLAEARARIPDGAAHLARHGFGSIETLPPLGVNLRALPTRLARTWWIRSRSAWTLGRVSGHPALELAAGAARGAGEGAADLFEQRAEIHRGGADRERLTAVDAGEGEEVGEEPLHAVGGAPDDAEDLRALVFGMLATVEERRADGDDVEGVAEVVRNHGQDFVRHRPGPEPHGPHGKCVLLAMTSSPGPSPAADAG